ncbi:carbohydrate ABC transporter permease [Neobacillus sedimentimangrovi]|uniref:carbohydrate ABC transporter permease n=1 Tax=Neobacillus sedimentimangrovi TaxID=2699460 RepID=UPI0013D29303|nr:sugar ABC transporter permease [Neobacillus sedimentimangrovi]
MKSDLSYSNTIYRERRPGMLTVIRENYKIYSIAYWFILPTIVYLGVFQLYPLIESFRLSFTNLNYLIPTSGQYVGLDNYKELLFHDLHFWRIVGKSFVWVILSTILQYLIAVPAAVILNQKLKMRSLWRGLIMVPWVTPIVIMGLIWKWIYDGDYGLLNHYLGTDFVWLGDSKTVWPSILLASTWKGFPYATIMILAGLQGIPKSLLEASYIDGCSKFQSFFKVTLPLLTPILAVSAMISVVITWTKFEMIWVLTAGGPGVKTSILPTYIYTKSFQNFEMGMGSAVAVLSMLIMIIFILLYFRILNRVQD